MSLLSKPSTLFAQAGIFPATTFSCTNDKQQQSRCLSLPTSGLQRHEQAFAELAFREWRQRQRQYGKDRGVEAKKHPLRWLEVEDALSLQDVASPGILGNFWVVSLRKLPVRSVTSRDASLISGAGLKGATRKLRKGFALQGSLRVPVPHTMQGRKSNAFLVRAVDGEGESEPAAGDGPPASKEAPREASNARGERERGQITAIVTGAISIFLGVAYLILVQVIDTRGVNMVPPPPEAYGE